MKLYTFSKNAWHVRFFKWLFGQDPTQRYKTMCPYFWTYVLILLFLPLILVIKLFGKWGTQFLAWVKDYKQNKTQAAIDHLIKTCSNPDLTPQEAYDIVRSKCYDKYGYWNLDYETKSRIEQLHNQWHDHLMRLELERTREKNEKREKMIQTYESYKEYKWFTYLSYFISFSLIGVILFAIGYGLYQAHQAIDWPWVGKWAGALGIIILTGASALLILYGFIKYMCIPFFKWLSCVKMPNCGLCRGIGNLFSYFIYLWLPLKYFLIGFGRILVIIGDMIYSTYKKKCPIITWED